MLKFLYLNIVAPRHYLTTTAHHSEVHARRFSGPFDAVSPPCVRGGVASERLRPLVLIYPQGARGQGFRGSDLEARVLVLHGGRDHSEEAERGVGDGDGGAR